MSTLKVTFTNKSNVDQSVIYIGFVTSSSNTEVSIVNRNDNSPIKLLDDRSGEYPKPGNWYSLSTLSSGIEISRFSGGRIYVCYGETWTVQSAGYEPAQAVTDANFFKRYDKMEITFTGQAADVANLTSIDYWSIPMTLETRKAEEVVQTVTGLWHHATTQQVFDALNKLTTPPLSGLHALPALVPGQFEKDPNGPAPGTAFARIIGPSSYPAAFPPPSGVPVMPYDLLEDYLRYLLNTFGPGTEAGAVVPKLGAGVIACIAGDFAGVGPNVPTSGATSRQHYDLSATIDADLNITLSGTLTEKVGGAVHEITMLYKRQDLLNPTGIYGGNAPYFLESATTSTAPGNDVYGWVGGDLFAGLNIGAVGSTTELKKGEGMVGAMESSSWFRLDISDLFSKLQPPSNSQPHRFYNQWAETLSGLSQAYNFAYSDRLTKQDVLISLNPDNVDTLEVVLEDATVRMD